MRFRVVDANYYDRILNVNEYTVDELISLIREVIELLKEGDTETAISLLQDCVAGDEAG